MHYETKDLREALELYGGVLASCPNAPEAEYSRAQIRNIVDAVVPKPLILETLLQLAITRLTHGDAALQADSSQAGPAPAGVSA
jgi:hypothetical protein